MNCSELTPEAPYGKAFVAIGERNGLFVQRLEVSGLTIALQYALVQNFSRTIDKSSKIDCHFECFTEPNLDRSRLIEFEQLSDLNSKTLLKCKSKNFFYEDLTSHRLGRKSE